MNQRDLYVPRQLLDKYFGRDPRLLRAFENQALAVLEHQELLENNVAATDALEAASVVTLSQNASLTNEFVLSNGDGTRLRITAAALAIDVDETVVRASDFPVLFVAPAPIQLFLPAEGTLISDSQAATLYNKTLEQPTINEPKIHQPKITGLTDAVDDAAANTAGVPINGVYRTGSVLKVRIV